jgi:murein DD-endopeptidase MepM/ murein hydrolase activator NlpD
MCFVFKKYLLSFYFRHALKKPIQLTCILFLLIVSRSVFWAQEFDEELFSEIEILEGDSSLPHAGGATEEELNALALFNDREAELQLFTQRDSIQIIPAYEAYYSWDTKNLFANRADLSSIGNGIQFQLAHGDCDFHYPAAGMMTSPFGPRWGRMHYGLDIDLEVGDNVFAAFEGMVRISQYHSTYGNVVVVRHNNGLETLYAHLSQRKVIPGDHVEAGDIIGFGGNTGRSYGAHLHFELRYKGQAFDPLLVVNPSAQALLSSSFTLLPIHFEESGVSPQTIAARKASSSSSKSSKSKYHVVKRGDSLYSIARKNGTSVRALCKLNRIKETGTLQLGQRIRFK